MQYMLAKIEAAARHRPIAHGPDSAGESVRESRRPQSETRLQAAIVGERIEDAEDPCADMPCTD